MRVIVACERSGIVRESFRRRGHQAVSCDIEPADDGSEHHIQGDIRDVLTPDYDLMIAHPPCQFTANSGVRWLHTKPKRWPLMVAGAEFARWLLDYEAIPLRCIEQPIIHGYAKEILGPHDQTVQPWMFGHPESKATCLRLRGLPPLQETDNVKHIMAALPRKERDRVHYASPGPERARLRSQTLPGLADAMAEQWGSL